jgi:hypothetical protein
VAITDKSGADGVALWVNEFLRRKGKNRISKTKMHKIIKWVADQYEVHGRSTAIFDEELEEQVRMRLPNYYLKK